MEAFLATIVVFWGMAFWIISGLKGLARS